jgi:hypothetical protein
MTSGLAALLLYVYLGIARHRSRKGRTSQVSVKRAYFAVEVAFSAFLLSAMLTLLFKMFRAGTWGHPVCMLPGIVDITGAIAAVTLAVRAERIHRKESAIRTSDVIIANRAEKSK